MAGEAEAAVSDERRWAVAAAAEQRAPALLARHASRDIYASQSPAHFFTSRLKGGTVLAAVATV